MLILRIRQAEIALRDGRLDEAYQLAGDEDLRAHRRGQELIGRLARALVERGREHLAKGRWPQALTDCEKAGKLGGNLAEAAELRMAVAEAMSAQQREDRKRADALAAARQHIEAGQLSAGEGILAGLGTEGVQPAALQKQAAAQRAIAEAALARARLAAERREWDEAIAALVEARRSHTSAQPLNDLAAQVTSAVTEAIRKAVNEGRLDLAESLIDRLKLLAGETISLSELSGTMGQCRDAMACIEQMEFRQAGEILRRVSAIWPEAGWPRAAGEAVEQAAEKLEGVRGGPLGLLPAQSLPRDRGAARDETGAMETMVFPRNHHGAMAEPLPSRFMLHVDGVGSYLVLRDRAVTIGPVSSSLRPDVGLMAEAGSPVVRIERTDEDYFLVADRQGVSVNNAATSRRLLANGDRVALSARCRMTFSLPHAASTSAVLHLSGTRLPSSDARSVILMDRSVVLGPGAGAHVRADQLADPVVLFVRNGQLVCQAKEEVTVNDRPIGASAGIPVGANVRVGPVSFVVARV